MIYSNLLILIDYGYLPINVYKLMYCFFFFKERLNKYAYQVKLNSNTSFRWATALATFAYVLSSAMFIQYTYAVSMFIIC